MRTGREAPHRLLEGRQRTIVLYGFDAPITSPVAVAQGRIFAPCEDGISMCTGLKGTHRCLDKISRSIAYVVHSKGDSRMPNTIGSPITAILSRPIPMSRD